MQNKTSNSGSPGRVYDFMNKRHQAHILLVLLVCFPVREQLREQTKQYEKSENDLKALQSVGQVRMLSFYYFRPLYETTIIKSVGIVGT